MHRSRTVAVELPPNVYWTTVKGKHYFFHQIGRGTKSAGPRTSLGTDARKLWDLYREKIGEPAAPVVLQRPTFRAMCEAWKASPEWTVNKKPSTQRDYGFYLGKMCEQWGDLAPWEVTPAKVLEFRDKMGAESPGSANHMIVVGKQLAKWGIPREYLSVNPFREIATLVTADDGYWPWPDFAVDFVLEAAPMDLQRLIFLGVETGQRESDLVRMGPGAVEGKGIRVRPQKTSRTRPAFWIPLRAVAVAKLARWATEPMIFTGGRWGREVTVPPGETFVISPTGQPYTPEGLRSRWGRWLDSDDGRDLVRRWQDWETRIRQRDGMELTDDMRPNLHGLRATAVVRRRLAGYSNEQVSNDIGMSMPMVVRYSRYIDQQQAASTNIVKLEAHRK